MQHHHRDHQSYPYDDQGHSYSTVHGPPHSSDYSVSSSFPNYDTSSHYHNNTPQSNHEAINPHYRSMMAPSHYDIHHSPPYPSTARDTGSQGVSSAAPSSVYAPQSHYSPSYPPTDHRSRPSPPTQSYFIPTPSEIAHSYSDYSHQLSITHSPTVPLENYGNSSLYYRVPPRIPSPLSHSHPPGSIPPELPVVHLNWPSTLENPDSQVVSASQVHDALNSQLQLPIPNEPRTGTSDALPTTTPATTGVPGGYLLSIWHFVQRTILSALGATTATDNSEENSVLTNLKITMCQYKIRHKDVRFRCFTSSSDSHIPSPPSTSSSWIFEAEDLYLHWHGPSSVKAWIWEHDGGWRPIQEGYLHPRLPEYQFYVLKSARPTWIMKSTWERRYRRGEGVVSVSV